MTGSGMEEAQNNIGKSLQSTSLTRKSCTKRSRKLKSRGNKRTSQISKKKYMDFLTNSKNKNFDHSSGNPSLVNYQNQKGDFTSEKRKRGRKRKITNENVEVDEAAKLQRRTRYLLIRMKIEQNLLDAYSTEGWKGQSREKIKPERELQRAKKQILKCKLGLRDALRQLDLLSSDGRIDESVIAPDGSVHHDNIHCAKCKLREAYLDNDIILCDGTCNCAFHQMCIDPPLLTENIPPGDQGWFCKYCICKTEIIDSMNAHLGTSYPHDTNWQDVFNVEATLPDDGDTILNQEEWPSDDSGDDDYDPDRIDNDDVSRVCSADKSSDDDNDDVNSSYSLLSLDDEVLDDGDESCKIIRNTGLESTSGSGSGTDCEFVSGRRQRRSVDYRKLYDEMFGKDALANEQVSEDEDWGPTNRKRREKESDAASTLMALCETEETSVKDTAEVDRDDLNLSCNDNKRSFLRIPAEAVEKLRAVFAMNELPSRAVKEDISKQLGLDPEKVNTWFRNARQLSLKTKRTGEDTSNQNDNPSVLKESESEPVKNQAVDEFPLQNNNQNVSLNVIHTQVDRRTKKFRRRNNAMSPTGMAKPQNDNRELHLSASTNKADGDVDLGENNLSLIIIKETTEKAKEKGVVVDGTSEGDGDQQARTAEAQMEKLCLLKTKLEKLQQVIQLRTPNRKGAKTTTPSIDHNQTIFVPVAHLKEKP